MIFTVFFVFLILFLINPNMDLRGNRQKMPDFLCEDTVADGLSWPAFFLFWLAGLSPGFFIFMQPYPEKWRKMYPTGLPFYSAIFQNVFQNVSLL